MKVLSVVSGSEPDGDAPVSARPMRTLGCCSFLDAQDYQCSYPKLYYFYFYNYELLGVDFKKTIA